MSKLKIGFVLDDSLDKADGIQQYVLAIGEWLRSEGHDVHYLVSTTERSDVANIHTLSKNVAVRFNGNRMSMPLPASKTKIRRMLEQEKFDVLHVQMLYSPLLAQKIINAAGPETVLFGTFHNVPLSGYVTFASRLLAIWNGRSLKRFDKIVSVSSAAQAFAKKAFGLETSILPNVVDYQRFSSAEPFKKDAAKLRILFLGRLVPRKGCLTLLEACALLQSNASLPAFEVMICGKGPLEAQLKQFVQANNLGSVVTFTGFVNEQDKPRYLRSADIAVFPSHGGESFGIVLIEAMAAGAAVLAGDNVGYRSVMQPKEELLFDPKSPQELADKLINYMTNASLRRDVQTWGKHYAEQFDTKIVGTKLLTLYEEALRKRKDVQ